MGISTRWPTGYLPTDPPDDDDEASEMVDHGDIGDHEPDSVVELLGDIRTPGAASAILRAMRGLDPRPGAMQAMAAAFAEIRDELIVIAERVISERANEARQAEAESRAG